MQTASLRPVIVWLLFVVLFGLPLTACSVKEQTRHGYVPDSDLIEIVQPGVHTKQQVQRLLGSPSSIGAFESQYWYYISKRIERLAMLEPELIDQTVLVIKFGPEDIVSDIQKYTMEDGWDINPVEKITPNRGTRVTIIQQLLGNIGRFRPQ